MSRPLSQDIRPRFSELCSEGHSARSTVQRLLISAATAVRFAAVLRGGGDLMPKPTPRRTGDGRLEDVSFIRIQNTLPLAFGSNGHFEQYLNSIERNTLWCLMALFCGDGGARS